MSGTGLGPQSCRGPLGPVGAPPSPPVAEGEKRWSEQLAWSGRTATPQDFPMLGVLVEGAVPDPQPPLVPTPPFFCTASTHVPMHICVTCSPPAKQTTSTATRAVSSQGLLGGPHRHRLTWCKSPDGCWEHSPWEEDIS